MQKLFFELIQISLGNKDGFDRLPSNREWQALFDLACKQSLESVLLEGVNRLKNAIPNANIDQNLLLEWIGVGLQTESLNKVQNERAKLLTALFAKNGFRSCVLKGQGTALYYDKPESRQCGDIDIWIKGHTDSTENTDFLFRTLMTRIDTKIITSHRSHGLRQKP